MIWANYMRTKAHTGVRAGDSLTDRQNCKCEWRETGGALIARALKVRETRAGTRESGRPIIKETARATRPDEMWARHRAALDKWYLCVNSARICTRAYGRIYVWSYTCKWLPFKGVVGFHVQLSSLYKPAWVWAGLDKFQMDYEINYWPIEVNHS